MTKNRVGFATVNVIIELRKLPGPFSLKDIYSSHDVQLVTYSCITTFRLNYILLRGQNEKL